MDKKKLSREALRTAKQRGIRFGDEFIYTNLAWAIGELHEARIHIKYGRAIGINDDIDFLDRPETEIADAHICMLSLAAYYQIGFTADLYSEKVEESLVGCKTFDKFVVKCGKFIGNIADGGSVQPRLINAVLQGIEGWCDKNDIDLEHFVNRKMEINKTRPRISG